jgi:RimJ/RimL family protein N-acetyltransferase
MTSVSIPTANLDLVLQSPEEVLKWVETLPPTDRAEVSPVWLERVRNTTPGDPWALSYLVIERASGATVGGCAFKGPPDANGTVEVAYGIDEAHRCRGFATEATAGLVQFAIASGLVRLICAHTRPDNIASTRVLAKCGFQHIGEVMDPEDGLVDRWELKR